MHCTKMLLQAELPVCRVCPDDISWGCVVLTAAEMRGFFSLTLTVTFRVTFSQL